LSRRATSDLIRILRRSAQDFGVSVARQSRGRLLARVRSIEQGKALGHPRQDVRTRYPVHFLNEHPWVICFNPLTMQGYRILHGARDFPAIFGGRSEASDPGTDI
jgi:plasmid stabilization system protein ParE